MEMFDVNKTIRENEKILMKLLKSESYAMITEGKVSIVIDDEGWFQDLVELILRKTANVDDEIVKIALEKKIDLYETSLKK